MWSRMSVDLSMERAALGVEILASGWEGMGWGEVPHLFEHVGLGFAGRILLVRRLVCMLVMT